MKTAIAETGAMIAGRRMVSPVDATIRDLERAANRNGGYVSHRERSRFDNAMRHLSEFQDRYYRGRLDKEFPARPGHR